MPVEEVNDSAGGWDEGSGALGAGSAALVAVCKPLVVPAEAFVPPFESEGVATTPSDDSLVPTLCPVVAASLAEQLASSNSTHARAK